MSSDSEFSRYFVDHVKSFNSRKNPWVIDVEINDSDKVNLKKIHVPM